MKRKIHELLEWYNQFTEKVYAPFKGIKRAGVFCCNSIVSLYVTTIIVLNFFWPMFRFRYAAFCGLVLFCIIYQSLKLFFIKCNISISCNNERGNLSWKLFLSGSIIVSAVFMLNLFAHYPGGISFDNINQWRQVQTAAFNNWHPAIHTMIIWLVTRIVPEYGFFIGVQIMVFSLLSGYLIASLAAWGIKKRWLYICLLVILLTRSTHGILLYAWKDTALTICLLCITVYMIHIILSDGKWLAKWYNAGAIAVVAALASIIRHNGFFFTLPLGLLLLIFYRKATRNSTFAVIASVLIVLGITQVLYRIAKVEYPAGQTYIESVGLPMTILSGVMVNNPGALDVQTREFLNKIADDQKWKDTYVTGSYNSIKWNSSASDVVAQVPPAQLISMTLRTIRNAPRESLLEVIALTGMVWDPLRWGEGNIGHGDGGEGVVYSRDEINSIIQSLTEKSKLFYSDIRRVIDMITPPILTSIGIHILFLLLVGVYSINRNWGMKSLFLFIPSTAYNAGTMLLLSGPDYRFFHFNTVITFPLIIALLAQKQVLKNYPETAEPSVRVSG